MDIAQMGFLRSFCFILLLTGCIQKEKQEVVESPYKDSKTDSIQEEVVEKVEVREPVNVELSDSLDSLQLHKFLNQANSFQNEMMKIRRQSELYTDSVYEQVDSATMKVDSNSLN